MEVVVRFTWLPVALILVGFAQEASAQTASPSADPGTLIFVTLLGGAPIEGSLIALSADSVGLLVDATAWTIPLEQVTLVQRSGDRSHDGAVKGALFVGLWCLRVCGQGLNNGNQVGWVVLSNATIGGLIGWAIDRGHAGRTTIYPFPKAARDTTSR
jgi:hypothetical protein